MIHKKDFKNDDDLLEFVNSTGVTIISTHTTPGKYKLASYSHDIDDVDDFADDARIKLKVTLLYRKKKHI